MDSSLSGSDFGQLRAFTAVAEALNYTRAAEALGITNSAVSRTVRLLEERIGVRLISRTTRTVALTEAGDRLFQRIKPAIRELDSAVGEAGRYRDRSIDIVRIHSSSAAAELFITPILRSFSDAYPQVMLDITLSDEKLDIFASDYDVAIQTDGAEGTQGVVSIDLGVDLRQIAVAAPDYLARHGTPESPHDLPGYRCIGQRPPTRYKPNGWEFFEDGKSFEVVVDGPVIANSRELAVQAAIDGLGIALVARGFVARHIAEGRLVPLLESWSPPPPGFYLCHKSQSKMTPKLRVFVDAICSRVPERE